jgi:hypothetical protein
MSPIFHIRTTIGVTQILIRPPIGGTLVHRVMALRPRVTTGVTALAALVLSAPAHAAVINAEPNPTPGTTSDGICTLREAVDAANTDTAGDCTAGSGADVINLPAGEYPQFGASGEDNNLSGDLDLKTDISFVGAGAATTTINGSLVDRVIDIQSGAIVSISGVTIKNGHAPAGGSAGAAGTDGGGIRNAGSLTLDGVTITQNAAGVGTDASGSGTGGSGGSGGGISSTGTLTITNSLIQDNHAGLGANGGVSGGRGGAGGSGGGIAASAATITDSTISGNSAGAGGHGANGTTPGDGGGGGNCGGYCGGPLTLTRATVTGNSAGNGGPAGTDTDSANTAQSGRGGDYGGVATSGIGSTISDTTITGNHAGNGATGASGTGIFAGTGLGGGGGGTGGLLLRVFSTATVTRTTIADNTAGSAGNSSRGTPGTGGYIGGLLVDFLAPGSTATIRSSAITGNTAGTGGSSTFANGGTGGGGGGVIVNPGGSAAFSNTTIAGNTSGAGGSGGLATGGRSGTAGGIWISGNTGVDITHVTIAQNQIGAVGGGNPSGQDGTGAGIYDRGGVSVANSIIASNTPDNCDIAPPTALTNAGHNILFGSNGGPWPCAIPAGADPLLGGLADNGGPTKTMALGEGSSAIDIVPVEDGCPAVDQRSVMRPQRSACDAGAFELEPPPAPPSGGGDQPPPIGDTQNQQPPPAGPAAADTRAPVVKLLLTKQRLRKALKKGYIAFFSDDELGTAAADLFASGRTAKGTAAKRKRVAHGTLKVTKTGKQKLVLKFTKKAKRAFARRKKVVLSLTLTVKDATGNTTRKTAKVTLKR